MVRDSRVLAGELIRGPWLGQGWDGQALLLVLAMLPVSLGLTAWRLRSEIEAWERAHEAYR